MTVSNYVTYIGLNCGAYASGLTELQSTVTQMQQMIKNMNQGNVYNVAQMIQDYNNFQSIDTSKYTQEFKNLVANFFTAYCDVLQTIQVSIDAGAGASAPFGQSGAIVNGHYAVLYDTSLGNAPANVLDLAKSMSETSSSRFTTAFIHWNSSSTVPWKGGTMGDDGEIDHVDANGQAIPGWGIQLNQYIFDDSGSIQGPPGSLVGTSGVDSYLQSNAAPTADQIASVTSILNQMGFPGS